MYHDEVIDLRSDGTTHPTEAMRDAMRAAETGVFLDHEDPTIARLEELGALQFGKEAAVFLPTVIMGNLIACMHHCVPGDQVILDEDCHLYRSEVSGMARVAGVMPRPVRRTGALPDIGAVTRALSFGGLGAAPIRLLWIENTHNVGGGAVADRPHMAELRAVAKEQGLAIHVDGARIFNAAVALGVPPVELAAEADSLAIGFDKGLACPMGCLLIGDRALIDSALRLRQMLGGRLQKLGVIAAACIVALNAMVDRLAEDHVTARHLGEAIAGMPQLRLDAPVVTNIVRFDTSRICSAQRLIAALAEEGILVNEAGPTIIRAVTHHHITPRRLDRAIEGVRSVVLRQGQMENQPA